MKLRQVEKNTFFLPYISIAQHGHKLCRAAKVHFLSNTPIPYVSIYPAFIRGNIKVDLENYHFLISSEIH